MSDPNSPKQSSSNGSATEQYIRIVEQLIDSDEDEQILKRLSQLQIIFPVLKKMSDSMTNQQKTSMFLRDHVFRMKLTEKLRQSNYLFTEPIIKVYMYTIRHRCQIQEQLCQNDLQYIFEKFGTVETLFFSKKLGYFRYDSYVSCYVAIKILNQFEINDTLRLSVGWCNQNDISTLSQHYAASCVTDQQHLIQGKKSTARYDIYLESGSDFELSKKIIGPKGANMKNILASVLQKHKIPSLDSSNSIAKLRLRGKGSGFKQGWNHAESQQMLNLCVSSKHSEVFTDLCEECEKLLFKIGCDYKQYYFKLHHKQCEGLIYRMYTLKSNNYQLTKQLTLEQVNAIELMDSAVTVRKKMKEKDILKLIAIRDKARRQGKFSEADQIREHLSKEGVMIIDEKHASGKGLRTSWKYI